MHQRYSEDRRWEAPAREICARLGTFTYHEVRNALRDLAYPKDLDAPRKNLGCHMPTEREIIQSLSRVDWCRKLSEPSKHSATVYEYREPSQADITACGSDVR